MGGPLLRPGRRRRSRATARGTRRRRREHRPGPAAGPRGAVGRRPRLWPLRPRRLRGLPGRGDHRYGQPGDDGSAAAVEPGRRSRQDQGTDAADPGHGRLAVPDQRGGGELPGHLRQRHAGPGGLVHRRPRRRAGSTVGPGPASLPDHPLARLLPARTGRGSGHGLHLLPGFGLRRGDPADHHRRDSRPTPTRGSAVSVRR